MKKPLITLGRSSMGGQMKRTCVLMAIIATQATAAWAEKLCYLTVTPVEATGLRLAKRVRCCEHYGICTVRNTGISWVDAVEPVTYQMDVSECGNLGVHLMLIPGAEACCKPCETPTSLGLQVQAAEGGGAQGDLVLTVGSQPTVLASVKVSCAKGTWRLVMCGLSATISAPDGKGASKDIPAKIVNSFRDPVRLYCFAKSKDSLTPNVTISRLRVLGLPKVIDERFTSVTLDTNVWQVPFKMAETPSVVPPTARFWLKWPVAQADPNLKKPHLEASHDLGQSWEDRGVITTAVMKGDQYAFPITADGSAHTFYRLRFEREFLD